MKVSQNGINLIKQFEGCRLEAYKCPAGVWTIGYGHTAGVKQGDKVSATWAEAILRIDLEKYEKKVDKYSNKYNWNQNEFDAMVSFAYNVGNIDQLTANGTRSKTVIAEKILSYNKAAGKVLTGLSKRRKAEQELFLKSVSVKPSPTRSTVKVGSRGTDVTYLQQRLTELGYNVGKIDGIFGALTLAAVKLFQAASGLVDDGIVGPLTWTEILK
ncbi:MAG: glycoside hydrolase family protein [Lachnospiraceae bacterium]|nr:glycoside hydrolase family protein [Lachnospiraceae bacterium]